ncbi:ATPase, F0 complex, subunit H [Ascosphaera apis ARSEF 7405]|uniref:ATPase, F0 complex, subunit H n=1 Tax=Ascosphaera apis ARSEF 7405 TaxID=392613 RepID=A0A168BT16_9EURO|nr:ATPase, F0 complex, subunit H [Ascosphaera apis ARSEF 7405]
MSQAFKLSRSLFTRAAARQPLVVARRSFVTTPVRGADLIQDLYLKEIRAYKAPQVKASDADAHVHKFSVPQPPPSPEEANLASELQDYEAQAVEVEGQAATGEAAPVEQDWFEDDWEEETPAAH